MYNEEPHAEDPDPESGYILKITSPDTEDTTDIAYESSYDHTNGEDEDYPVPEDDEETHALEEEDPDTVDEHDSDGEDDTPEEADAEREIFEAIVPPKEDEAEALH